MILIVLPDNVQESTILAMDGEDLETSSLVAIEYEGDVPDYAIQSFDTTEELEEFKLSNVWSTE